MDKQSSRHASNTSVTTDSLDLSWWWSVVHWSTGPGQLHMSLLGISAFLHADLVKTTLLVHLCEDRHPVFLIILTIILRQRGNFVNYHLQIVVDNDGLLLLGIETLEHLHLSLSVEPAIQYITMRSFSIIILRRETRE